MDLLRGGVYVQRLWQKFSSPALRREQQAKDEFYLRMWRSAAHEIGAEFFELTDGLCEIRLNDAVTRLYHGFVPIDNPVNLKIAGNKPLVHKLLARAGLPVPVHYEFTLESIEHAERFLERQACPCVVKPACETGAGDGVVTGIRTKKELRRAAIAASLFGRRLLIEKHVVGEAYRLLYLNGNLLQCISRSSPRIIGDGKSTVRELIEIENKRRETSQGASVTRLHVDQEMKSTLLAVGLSLNSVIPSGSVVTVKRVVNDNGQADNRTVTSEIGYALREEGARAAAVLGVELAAVDVITTNPRISLRDTGGAIIEVNTTPGLHHHYNLSNADESRDVGVCILEYLLRKSRNERMENAECSSGRT